MEILIAIAHIVGSIIALLAFGFVVLFIGGWGGEKIQKQVAEEASIKLGISIEDLDKDEHAKKVLKLSSEKFSSELFANRISDFCGVISTIWGWLSNIVQAVALIAVIWYTFTDSTEHAVYAWFILGISIFAWLVSVLFSLTCRLLTGRYPGQAKATRKTTAEWIQNNSELLRGAGE